jgi:hypothetical protein
MLIILKKKKSHQILNVGFIKEPFLDISLAYLAYFSAFLVKLENIK